MAWTTAFTDMLGVRYPIVSAPMGGSAGGALAAAVSNAGGLGMLGGGSGRPKWLDPELAILAPPQPVWAGEAADLITDLPPAAEVVPALVREAEQALSRVG